MMWPSYLINLDTTEHEDVEFFINMKTFLGHLFCGTDISPPQTIPPQTIPPPNLDNSPSCTAQNPTSKLHAYMHVCTHANIYTYMHMHIGACTHVYTHTMHTCVHAYIHTYIYSCIHIYLY